MAGMVWGACGRGEGVQETVAGGSRNEGSLRTQRAERVKFLAMVRGWGVGVGGAKNKGAPILCLGPQTAAPSPQLPVPPTSLGITLGMRAQAGPRPAPPVPTQQALSPQPAPTCKPLTSALSPAGSAAGTRTQSLSFWPSMEEGRPRSSLSLASSASTISSLSSLSTKVGAS